ncbi:iron chaperone [Shewanella algae]|uniref:iron chaperone n=1 Tax=Shewanella TaxID=22 RepID=UPI0035315EBA
MCELMNYNIPAFALVEGGKREKQIMIAGYKQHVGFYPHPDVIEEFKKQLSGFKYAKGSVQFPLNKPIPEELVAQMVKCRVAQLKQLIDTEQTTVASIAK